MGQITSSVGLISGINTGAIINELISLDQQPITLLQSQMAEANAQKQAFQDLETSLNSIQSFGQTMSLASTWGAATATSSNQNVLTATTTNGAAIGSYQFQVAQTVSTQQSVTEQGFSDYTTTKMTPGTITLSEGPAGVVTQTPLSSLNGGKGIPTGTFRITDSSGKSDTINTAGDVTLDDVLNQINTAPDVSVRASIGANGLVLTDTAGGTGSLAVTDLGNGTTAASLGLTTATASATTATNITGATINYLSRSTTLAALNDGNGISAVDTNGESDFTITAGNGSSYQVTVAPTAATVGDVIDAINTATGGKVVASILPGSSGITLTDASGGGGNLTVTANNGSSAAKDLGILGSASGTLSGQPVIAGLDTVLLSSLNGGQGLSLGTINITDRNGNLASIDLSGDSTLQEVLNSINTNGVANVTASVNQAGDGIQIVDNTNGSGNLIVADANGGTSAAQLGIAGSFDTTVTADVGGPLHRQWMSGATQLSDINGGKGVSPGSFTITNAKGNSSVFNITTGNQVTVGDVINEINSRQMDVTASIDATGDGILLTDSSGGAGKLTVASTSGSTATDLNIAGTATGTTIDGSFTKTIAVTANDTLQSVQQKINALNFGVNASIINDGSSVAPYRLQLTAQNSGLDGQVVIDAGSTGLQTEDLVKAQDAAVYMGDPDSGTTLLFTSSSNTLNNVIPGVNISLLSASSSPVTLSVTQDTSSIETQMNNFVSTFNGLVQSIGTLTAFNTSNNQGSLLLGDSTIQDVQTTMFDALNTDVQGAGEFTNLSQLGITIGNGAQISFNTATFEAAYAKDPTAVQNLFTQAKTGLGAVISNQMDNLTDPVSGIITLENQSIETQVLQYSNQITNLNQLLADKKNTLEQQFANMESVLAGLQEQQGALASLASISTTPAASSSSTSSSSSTGSSSTAA